jgi:hypothetical protein
MWSVNCATDFYGLHPPVRDVAPLVLRALDEVLHEAAES